MELFHKIKVLGVGGCGSNIVNRIIEREIYKDYQSGGFCSDPNEDWTYLINRWLLSFCVADTDAQALNNSSAKNKIQLGEKITKGLSCNGNVEIGICAAKESKDEIKKYLNNTDILIVISGMGGGTGTGATTFIAEMAKELGILVAIIVTKPFSFEGKRRCQASESGIKLIRNYVELLFEFPNDKLIEHSDENMSMEDSYRIFEERIIIPLLKKIIDLNPTLNNKNEYYSNIQKILLEQQPKLLPETPEGSNDSKDSEKPESLQQNQDNHSFSSFLKRLFKA